MTKLVEVADDCHVNPDHVIRVRDCPQIDGNRTCIVMSDGSSIYIKTHRTAIVAKLEQS